MDWVLAHLLFYQFPVVLAVMGVFAAALALVRARRGIWLYAAVSLTLAAVMVIPTYFTGAPAHRALGSPLAAASGSLLTHEDAGKVAALLVVLAGLVGVVAWRRLVRYPREVRMPGSLRAAILLTSLASAAAIGYASWLGGRMAHDPRPATATLVRPGVPSAPPAAPAPSVAPTAVPPTTGDSASPPAATVSPAPTLPDR